MSKNTWEQAASRVLPMIKAARAGLEVIYVPGERNKTERWAAIFTAAIDLALENGINRATLHATVDEVCDLVEAYGGATAEPKARRQR